MIPEELQDLRARGWMLRVTEWTFGVQCCAFHRSWPARWGVVSPWRGTEAEAWADVAAGVVKVEAEMQAELEAGKAARAEP